MRYVIECEECDSEYTIESEYGMITDDPQYCSICKSKITPELIEDE